MNELKTSLHLLPLIRGLYLAGVIDISPGRNTDDDYIQLTVEAFNKLFPDVEFDARGHLVTYMDGVRVIAVKPNV